MDPRVTADQIIVSMNTGSHTSSDASSYSTRSTADRSEVIAPVIRTINGGPARCGISHDKAVRGDLEPNPALVEQPSGVFSAIVLPTEGSCYIADRR